MKHYLVCENGGSGKFWMLTLEGTMFTVTFGKVGTSGQSQIKSFDIEAAARKEAEKLLAAKRKKGYVDAPMPDTQSTTRPAAKKTAASKRPEAKTVTLPKAGPAPLADDGKPKPWHDEYDKIFEPERLRNGLDETAEENEVLQVGSGETAERIKILIKAHECEDDPLDAFYSEAAHGDNRMDQAVFLYENLVEPLGKERSKAALKNAFLDILGRNKRIVSEEDFKMLHFILERCEIDVKDEYIIKKVRPKNPVLQDYWQLLQQTRDPDELDRLIGEKVAAYCEPAVQFFDECIRNVLDFLRNGTELILHKRQTPKDALPGGCMPDAAFGFGFNIWNDTLNLSVLAPGNLWSIGSIKSHYFDFDLPENLLLLDDFRDGLVVNQLKNTLPQRLEAMYQEGLFDGLFDDFFVFKGQHSNEVLYHRELTPQAGEALSEQAEKLRTSTNWQENAGLLPRVVALLAHGAGGVVENEKALEITHRHLYCPSKEANHTAFTLLDALSSNYPCWECEELSYKTDNIKLTNTLYSARRLIAAHSYQPGEALLNRLELLHKRRVLLNEKPNIPGQTEMRIERRSGMFEDIFTEKDLFIETKNIIARAYKSGVIAIRFYIEGEEGYSEALDFINALLVKNYAEKSNGGSTGGFMLQVRFLHKPMPIKQMEKAKVWHGEVPYPFNDCHAFFARAVQYPDLRARVETYANLALQRYHWYSDLDGEYSTVPGTFAATALAFCGLEYMPVVCRYAAAIDGDHSCMHDALPKILLKHYGPQPEVYNAVAALCSVLTQDAPVSVPKKILASGPAAEAFVKHILNLDMPERSRYEHLYFIMAHLVGGDENGILKTLARYVAAAPTPEEKGPIIDLYNLYRKAIETLNLTNRKTPGMLPQAEGCHSLLERSNETGGQPELPDTDREIIVERFAEPAPSVITREQADSESIAYGEEIKERCTCFFAPSLQEDYEEMDFITDQWHHIKSVNEKGTADDLCRALVYNEKFAVKMGNWVVNSKNFAAEPAMVLFDGKNRPYVLYGFLDVKKVLAAFKDTATLDETNAERIRQETLVFKPHLRVSSTESRQAAELLYEATELFLCSNHCVAEILLREIKKEDNLPAYISSRIILSYIARWRGNAAELEVLCEELAALQPEKEPYWTAKMDLAHTVSLVV